MIDATTNKPLRVLTGRTWSIIEVPVSRLEEVQRLLDRHGIRYWVSEDAFSFNGGPEESTITLNPGTDPQAVQAILDSVP